MSSLLIEKIRKARQTRVTHKGKTFLVRRPTDWEMCIADRGANKQLDILEKFVEGWEGITELDLVPGGDSTPAEFSKELFSEWAQDNLEYWEPIISGITAEYKAHAEKLAEAEKK